MAMESENLSVGTSSVTATFSAAVYYVEIYNAGSDTCFININAAATVNHFPVLSGETLKLMADIDDVRAICDAGDSTTLQIIGTR